MFQFLLGVLLLASNFLGVSRASAATCQPITTLQELRDMGTTGNYCLANDIDASPTSATPFTPIGSETGPFIGVFNGNDHVIDKLTIAAANYNGLFGYIESPGIVRNVNITNGRTGKPRDPNIDSNAGLLAGRNSGDVENCSATGSVSSFTLAPKVGGLIGVNTSSVTASHAAVSVLGKSTSTTWSSFAGGLVGVNWGKITKSYASGGITVVTPAGAAGGFVGGNAGIIEQSYATGKVNGALSGFAGGFVGVAFSGTTIRQSYATGSITAGANTAVGGFAGDADGTISESYSAGLVTGGRWWVGGFVGYGPNGTYSRDYWDKTTSGQTGAGPTGTKGLTTAQLKAALPPGFDRSVWKNYTPDTARGVAGTYPYLAWQKAFLVLFPVKADSSTCHPSNCTAYNVNITTVMDHAGTPLDRNPTTTLPIWYQESSVPIPKRAVTAYTGETGTWASGRDADATSGYKKDPSDFSGLPGPNFSINGHYVGASVDATKCGVGMPPCPCQATSTCAKTFLNYDGHSGYDYPFPGITTTIVAPATGRLYKATTADSVNDRERCSKKGWNEWHSFYIVHGTGDADFMPNGYSTWYLHVDSLALTIPATPGYVFVHSGDPIAFVGCYGPITTTNTCTQPPDIPHQCGVLGGVRIPYHLHFEVRKTLPGGIDSDVVDPYAEDLWLR